MKIAIVQTSICLGGRIKVLLGITKALNKIGVTPVWMTYSIPGPLEEISKKYGEHLDFKVRLLDRNYSDHFFKCRLGEYEILRCNRKVSALCLREGFDWVINSSNTLQGFESSENVISYVHFPREMRASSELDDIHNPDSQPTKYSKNWLKKILYRQIYRKTGEVAKEHYVISNSEFTKEAVQFIYGETYFDTPIEVIYPFASDTGIERIDEEGERRGRLRIASLGRICEAKRQLEQAEMALHNQEVELWIMGHAYDEDPYYQAINILAEKSNGRIKVLGNLNYSEIQKNLSACEYFLHTNINEPFGITSVEAIRNGLIPIVHDSGGQREVVPKGELRFKSLSEIPGLLAKLDKNRASKKELVDDLQKNADERFSERVFIAELLKYFEQLGICELETLKV